MLLVFCVYFFLLKYGESQEYTSIWDLSPPRTQVQDGQAQLLLFFLCNNCRVKAYSHEVRV